MKLTMLGTGNAVVTECYNTCFVLEDEERTQEDRYFLVDGGGGNGLLHQLKEAGISWKDIRVMFLTHRHLDHLMGMIWMLRMILQNMQRGNYEGEAVIYGHDEVIALLRELAEKLLTKKECAFLDERLHLVEVKDGEEKTILGRRVTFFDIHSTKAKQFGFCMELEAGENGRKLTCCGDEPYNECERSYAEGADWLLLEAFCLHSQADIFKPYQKNHSTAADAAKLAEELGAKNVILYHTEDRNIKERKQLYTEEGRNYFHGNLLVPEDLEVILL